MRGIFIPVQEYGKSSLDLDMVDVLRAIGPEAISSTWRFGGPECLGEGADELHALDDAGTAIRGDRLIDLTSKIYQTYDGYFDGYESESSDHPWVSIRAVDGAGFAVYRDDQAVLDRLKRHFESAKDLPAV
jgi:hypothetical protein